MRTTRWSRWRPRWRYGDFAAFLGDGAELPEAWQALRRTKSTGRPLGDADWIAGLEATTGRTLAPQKRGPKPKVLASG